MLTVLHSIVLIDFATTVSKKKKGQIQKSIYFLAIITEVADLVPGICKQMYLSLYQSYIKHSIIDLPFQCPN